LAAFGVIASLARGHDARAGVTSQSQNVSSYLMCEVVEDLSARITSAVCAAVFFQVK
jgi:hypothetical protein